MNQGHITGEVMPEDLDVEGLMTLVMEEMDHDHDGRS
jgi:hypothetical protein